VAIDTPAQLNDHDASTERERGPAGGRA